ncbi:hypothetical protein QTO34_014619 [Cnephaeus nilssonii]|uniref:Ragulator complex protein LAMTOR1 n=1 Tax=Cnephaeus nilssonii TaxID=3371016 RepID=A0AA40I7P3_CNENI|nr:hypothetical protein QTO34_014619 [Eptesicus nilssonii]
MDTVPPHGLNARPSHGVLLQQRERGLDQDREERKLLLDPSSPPTKALNGAEPNYHSLPSARTDEQALLSSILAKTASNIIDTPRARSSMSTWTGKAVQHPLGCAEQQPDPLEEAATTAFSHQSAPPSAGQRPIPFSDMQQVSRIAAYAYSALSQIRVDTREELVVQFGIP